MQGSRREWFPKRGTCYPSPESGCTLIRAWERPRPRRRRGLGLDAGPALAIELILPALAFCAGAAAGFLGNKYWPLVGFRATAACLGLLLVGAVLYVASNDAVLAMLGPYAKGEPVMFKLYSAALGLFIFLGGAWVFEKNYEKLEQRLRQKQLVTVVQAPTGPSVDELAKAVADRITVAQGIASAPTTTKPTPPTLEERVRSRAREVLPRLTPLTAEGERIFRSIIGDPAQPDHLLQYQRQIEDWRTRVGNTYAAELPNSGAREEVIPKTGVLGQGPIAFELSRLVNAIENQRQIIRDLEKYVQRSLVASDEQGAKAKH